MHSVQPYLSKIGSSNRHARSTMHDPNNNVTSHTSKIMKPMCVCNHLPIMYPYYQQREQLIRLPTTSIIDYPMIPINWCEAKALHSPQGLKPKPKQPIRMPFQNFHLNVPKSSSSLSWCPKIQINLSLFLYCILTT